MASSFFVFDSLLTDYYFIRSIVYVLLSCLLLTIFYFKSVGTSCIKRYTDVMYYHTYVSTCFEL